MADAHANFAYSTVLTAPSPATSGTSLVLQSGAGALMPAVPFNATAWPAGQNPSNSNAEIVRVTAISTDTLTITRAQEGTTAKSIAVGYQFSASITVKTMTDVEPYINPTGSVQAYAGVSAPTNWLLCNGQAVSRATYATLWALLNPTVNTATITIATPGVITTPSAHGLKNGDTVYFTTTGALPTGITANTVYYVTVTSTTTFQLSTSTGGVGVIYVNTSGTQSGTHTVTRTLFGLGDGSTTFNVPDLRGRVPAGVEDMGGAGNASRLTGFANAPPNPLALGNFGGTETHTLTLAQSPSHSHSWMSGDGQPTGGSAFHAAINNAGFNIPGPTTSAGSDGAHNNVQPTLLMNYIIKT